MITEQQAVEAAERFLTQRKHTRWDENSVRVTFSDVGERPTFVVSACDAVPPGEEDWMQPPPVPVAYLVDAVGGAVYAIETERGRTVVG